MAYSRCIMALLNAVTLLEQLSSISSSDTVFGKHMKNAIVGYALSITALQRLLRIEDVLRKNNSQMLVEELKNSGHSNWHPAEYPDWILLEIDANILIRPDQVNVANA